MRAPVASEQAEQRAFIKWVRLIQAGYPDLWLEVIDHGQRMSMGQIQKAKARGYRAGVPDVVGCYRGRFFAIEMKREKGSTTSEEQKAMHRAITAAGGLVFVAKGFDAARAFMETTIFALEPAGHGRAAA